MSATGKYTNRHLLDPDRGAVRDSKDRVLATFTNDAYTVVLPGPRRKFVEGKASVSHAKWVCIYPAPFDGEVKRDLTPGVDPQGIDRLFSAYISHITPPAVRATLRTHLAAKPAIIDRQHPAMRAAAEAYRRGFNVMPVFLRSGGTIPVVTLLQEKLGIQTVLMGFALPDDRLHGPNEKFHLPTFFKGIATSIAFLDEMAKMRPAASEAQRWRPALATAASQRQAQVSP
jgi:acetylornithine deacetylase/succinyl-diaminopimelate desuccinylase-like protein